MTEGQVEVPSKPTGPAPELMPDVPKDSKLKHRPKSLNLLDTNNSDVALQIVSPGLPTLNAEMQSTVKISQKIELQQRHLIAARQSGNPPSSSSSATDTSAADDHDKEEPTRSSINTLINHDPLKSSRSPSPTLKNTHSLDKLDALNTPTTAKRLKRDNVPTPLTIGAASQSGRPSIQSAPIRQSSRPQYPLTSRQVFQRRQPIPGATPTRMTNPHHQHQALLQQQQAHQQPQQAYATGHYYPSPHQHFYPSPVKRQYRPFPNAQITYLTLPTLQPYPPAHPQQPTTPFRRSRILAPYTTTSPYFPRGIRRQPVPPVDVQVATPTTKGKPYSVTDVYRGDLQMAAPISSQPLSAQKEYFNKKDKNQTDDDRLPVSEDEIKEMQAKYNSNSEPVRPAPAQYAPYATTPVNTAFTQQPPVKQGEIFGSINMMNESIFNFRIFNPTSESRDGSEDDEDDIEVTEITNHDEQKVSDTDVPTGTRPKKDNLAWLAKEKEKFMKICETSWDEFVNTKKL